MDRSSHGEVKLLKLDREYEIVRPQVENGESLVQPLQCMMGPSRHRINSMHAQPSNGRPTAMPSGDFVACGRYEQGATAWIQEQEFPALNLHVGANGRTPIGCQTRGGVTFLLGGDTEEVERK